MIKLTALLTLCSGVLVAQAATLHLDAREIATTGIKTAILPAAPRAQMLAAQGSVLDPTAMMQTEGSLLTATADVAAARAEMNYTSGQEAQNRTLYRQGHNISRSSLEQSIATADSAAATLSAARARLATEKAAAITQWGPALTQAMLGNAPLIGKIADDQLSLIGVSLPPGVLLSEPPATATADFSGQTYSLALIGGTPGMLGGVPGEALLYDMPTQSDLPIGTFLDVGLTTGPKVAGVVVPGCAVVWEDGKPVAYLAQAHGNFAPVDLSAARPVQGGYFMASPLAPGDRIVTQGAELLAAAPTNVKAKADTADPDDD